MNHPPRTTRNRPSEKHSEERTGPRAQDTDYSQHSTASPAEFTPASNPSKELSYEQAEQVDREALLKDIDNLDNEQMIRLSRLSYLKYINRYNVRN